MGESATFNLRSADRDKPARPHFHDRASKEFPGLCAFEHSLKISQTFNEIGLGLGIRGKISFGTSRSKTNLTNSILKSFPFTPKTKRLENDRKSSTNPVFPVGRISLVFVSPFSLTSDFLCQPNPAFYSCVSLQFCMFVLPKLPFCAWRF